jgi:hypothetical protein
MGKISGIGSKVYVDLSWCLIAGQFTSEKLERVAPLLTVETEANGDSRSTFEGGPSLVGSLSSSTREFLSCLGCPSRPMQ